MPAHWRERWLWPFVAATIAAGGGFASVAVDFADPPRRGQVLLGVVAAASAGVLAFVSLRIGQALQQRRSRAVRQSAETPSRLFISHISADRGWATWLREQLTTAGYVVSIQDWRFQTGVDLGKAARESASGSRCVIVLVSRAFVASPYAAHAWTDAVLRLPRRSRLIVKVDGCAVPPGLSAQVDLDIFQADAEAARGAVLLELAQRQIQPAAGARTTAPDGAGARFPGHGPAVTNIPPRNPMFTGRLLALDDIHRDFAQHVTGRRSRLIYGLGGVGKSQLVCEFAHRHGSDYDITWWVRADNEAAMLADLLFLAGALDVPDTADQAQMLLSLWRRLDQTGRWLIVFDGADPSVDLTPCWPHAANGNVLLTSRSNSWTNLVSGSVQLPVLGEEESITFLLARGKTGEEEATARIAEQLGRLPLALEQAGAYMEETGTTAGEYEQLLRHRATDVLDRLRPRGYPDTVATTWSMSVRQAERDGAGARDLLTLFAFLAADDIPRSLASDNPAVLAEPLRSTVADPIRYALAVRALIRYSLIHHDRDALHVHRLVQATVRQSLKPAEERQWTQVTARLLTHAYQDDGDDGHQLAGDRLLPHVLTVVAHAERCGLTTEEVGHLLRRAGRYLAHTGELVRARRYLERALTIREHHHSGDGAQVAESLMDLARLAYYLGTRSELGRGRGYAERALRAAEAAHGPDHPLVGEILIHLGAILRMLNDLPAARVATERGLRIRIAAFGADDPRVAEGYDYLGYVLIFNGDLGEAEQVLERALAITRSSDGDVRYAVGRILKHLGTVHKITGRLPRARTTLEEAVKLLAATGGPDHIDTLAAENELADVSLLTGQVDEAASRLEHVLMVRRARHGDHPYVAWSLARQAITLREQGRLADAEQMLSQALRIVEQALGADDPTIGEILARLGSVRHRRGELVDAEETLRRAVQFCERTCSPYHPYLVSALTHLAQVKRDQGEDAEAARLGQRASAIRAAWRSAPDQREVAA